jgi:hypothetical protein
MYKVSVNIYLISEDEITKIPTLIFNNAVIKGTVFLLFSGELYNGHCDALLPVEEKSL